MSTASYDDFSDDFFLLRSVCRSEVDNDNDICFTDAVSFEISGNFKQHFILPPGVLITFVQVCRF
jgi:hypothetical protein